MNKLIILFACFLLMGMSNPKETCPAVEWADPTERTNNAKLKAGDLQYITLYNQFEAGGIFFPENTLYPVGTEKRSPFISSAGRCPICTKATVTALSTAFKPVLEESEMSACL